MNVGVIGLGVMGRPMARNLLAAGHRVVVQSRSPGPVDELVGLGGVAALDPAAVGEAADVIILVVPDTADAIACVSGRRGLLETVHAGALVIDMGTHDPMSMTDLARSLEVKGALFLDAPVSGGESSAKEGTLSIMVGGSDAAFERGLEVLRVLGSTVTHVGDVGAGQVAKACNQLVVGATIEAVAEALTLASAAGVDPRRVRDALLGGFASSRVLTEHGKRMLDRQFTPGGRAALHAKDARIILATAARLGVPTPGFTPVATQFDALVERGGGALDHSALITLLESPEHHRDGREPG
jgi:2-hydroxy-3-oxopropionate reductase